MEETPEQFLKRIKEQIRKSEEALSRRGTEILRRMYGYYDEVQLIKNEKPLEQSASTDDSVHQKK